MTELKTETGRVGRFRTSLIRWAKLRLGAWGEWVALRYLRRNGWDIVARNWETPRGELDLIAFEGDTLVFIEVKTRKVPSQYPPEWSVDSEKKDRLGSLADSFLLRNEISGVPIRFDLVAVETPDRRSYTIRHYQGFM